MRYPLLSPFPLLIRRAVPPARAPTEWVAG